MVRTPPTHLSLYGVITRPQHYVGKYPAQNTDGLPSIPVKVLAEHRGLHKRISGECLQEGHEINLQNIYPNKIGWQPNLPRCSANWADIKEKLIP
jgi:hypothetical protein